MANTSKVNRDSAPIGSWPISENSSPVTTINKPLTNTPDEVAAMTIRASTSTAASSGGPINSAISAIGPMNRMVTISLDRSPNTEENSAISSALRACLFLVRAGPSKVVATAAPVPGIDTRIAGMLPPKMPPL